MDRMIDSVIKVQGTISAAAEDENQLESTGSQ